MRANLSLDRTTPHDFEPEPQDWSTLSLDQIGVAYGTDKSSLDHDYLKHYEAILEPMRNKPIRLLEIGVACGASLKTWARWAPKWSIYGVDVRPECATLCQDYKQIDIYICDATKEVAQAAWDVIIDDGSHVAQDILDAFSLHWPLLNPGGYYFIEDTACTFSGYRTHLQTDESRYNPAHYENLVTASMRSCDQGRAVEYVHHWKQLTVVRKLP